MHYWKDLSDRRITIIFGPELGFCELTHPTYDRANAVLLIVERPVECIQRLFNFDVLINVMFYPMLLVTILLSSGVAIPIASAQTWESRICIECASC